jgi:TatD DNase family protein
MSSLVDSHCHLDIIDLKPFGGSLDRVVESAREQGVDHLLCVCIDLHAFPAMLRAVEDYEQVHASVGVHPNHRVSVEPQVEDLVRLAEHPKVVAIGETGLDYFRSQGDCEWQRARLRRHIAAARDCGKPLIIHMREAREDTLRILQEEQAGEVGGVMHCFTEDWETAQRALDLGFYISFSGIVTFGSAESLREVARRMPLERMLVETDSPYLAPEPHRGKANQPAYVRHVAEYIAALRGVPFEELAAATTRNFFTLFRPEPS